jgi:superfamily II DNA/RNA helicase
MHEFRVSQEDFIELQQDPAILFALAVGILGDVAAAIADELREDVDLTALAESPRPTGWDGDDLDPVSALRFASTFFDAFLNARLNETITVEFSLLCATAYYLSGNVGSAAVITRRMDVPSLDLCGGLGLLLHRILSNDFQDLQDPHRHDGHTSAILSSLHGFMCFESNETALIEACRRLRTTLYKSGSSSELLYGDLVSAVCLHKLKNASRTILPVASGMSFEEWQPALAKPHFPIELWPAQQRIAAAGLLQGASAVIQMPTSAGKTRATELIVRAAFLSKRASLAVIVAPYRSLCHDIRGDLTTAFVGEAISLDEVSDSYQLDVELQALLARDTVLIVTPEKLLYMLRRVPDLAQRIGLVIYDEGHQFDSLRRGPTYELLLTSLKMALAPTTQTVLISAVIGNASEVADWLIGDSGAIVSGEGLLPTTKSIAFASWEFARGQLHYVSPTNPDETEFYVPRIITDIGLELKPSERSEKRFPEKNDGGDVGLFLGLHVVPNGSVAIFCGRKDSAAKLCRRAVEIFERKAPYLKPLDFSDKREVEKIRDLSEAHLGAGAGATRAAGLGIFAHHADTPRGLRLAIEHAMKDGLTKFVICTSTLAQGVNFPLKYLIVTSTRQGGERLLVRDFHNLMGRAGRAGMHTEGSVIFSTPTVFDQRSSRSNKWRWEEAKDLLDARNSEPCTSSILAIFDDYEQRNKGAPPIVQEILADWLDLAFADRTKIDSVVAAATKIQPNISANEFRKFIESRARIIQSIAAFLVANLTFEQDEIVTERVTQLVANTLAFDLADDDQKGELIDIFNTIATSISNQTDGAQRINIRKSPLPPQAIAELDTWLQSNFEILKEAINSGGLLETLTPIIFKYTEASSINNLSKAEVLPVALSEWVAGRSYTAVHDLLVRNGVRVGRNKATVEDAVALCENGFGYDAAMVVASLADLTESLDQNAYRALSLLQRQVKHGLSDGAAIAFIEAGFADRVVATRLAQAWPGVRDRSDVVATCKQERAGLEAILESLPSYFKAVAAEHWS